MADNAADVFVYTGEGAVVPEDVVRVRIDPSVHVIPRGTFYERWKLEKVELHEKVFEIGRQAFDNCTALKEVQSSDGVESIGNSAFRGCNFAKFRCPPLVTTISQWMLRSCPRMFSLEKVRNNHSSGRECVRRLSFIAKYCPRIQHRG